MERYSMFLGSKNQYCENDYTTKAIYRFCVIPIKLPMAFFTKLEQKISQFIWKHKRPQIAKEVLRKKNGAGGINLQTIIQSCSHQSSMVLAQKLKYRPVEQDRKPRNKPMHLWIPYFWQRRQEYTKGQRHTLKWCWENWTATCKRMKLEHFLMPYTEINSKWIKDLNVRPETIKLRRKHRQNIWWHKSKQDLLGPTSQCNGKKNKNKQVRQN